MNRRLLVSATFVLCALWIALFFFEGSRNDNTLFVYDGRGKVSPGWILAWHPSMLVALGVEIIATVGLAVGAAFWTNRKTGVPH